MDAFAVSSTPTILYTGCHLIKVLGHVGYETGPTNDSVNLLNGHSSLPDDKERRVKPVSASTDPMMLNDFRSRHILRGYETLYSCEPSPGQLTIESPG